MEDKDWHALHTRKARGEALSESELQNYRQGLAQRETEETLVVDLTALLSLRGCLNDLEARKRQLEVQHDNLTRQIEQAEQALDEKTRRAIASVA
jgi:hypothetical protein